MHAKDLLKGMQFWKRYRIARKSFIQTAIRITAVVQIENVVDQKSELPKGLAAERLLYGKRFNDESLEQDNGCKSRIDAQDALLQKRPSIGAELPTTGHQKAANNQKQIDSQATGRDLTGSTGYQIVCQGTITEWK